MMYFSHVSDNIFKSTVLEVTVYHFCPRFERPDSLPCITENTRTELIQGESTT